MNPQVAGFIKPAAFSLKIYSTFLSNAFNERKMVKRACASLFSSEKA